MPRRYSYSHFASELARDSRRRERERQRETKQLFLVNRIDETDEKNRQLQRVNQQLLGILQQALSTENNIQFDNFRDHSKFQEFLPPIQPTGPKREPFIPKEPQFFEKLLPGWQDRYKVALKRGEARYQASCKNFLGIVAEYEARVIKLKDEYEKEKALFELKIQEQNQKVDQFDNA